jgi:hypothetical protein
MPCLSLTPILPTARSVKLLYVLTLAELIVRSASSACGAQLRLRQLVRQYAVAGTNWDLATQDDVFLKTVQLVDAYRW